MKQFVWLKSTDSSLFTIAGLDILFNLTKEQSNELRVEEIIHQGQLLVYSQYANFSIGPAPDYTLFISGGSGNSCKFFVFVLGFIYTS